MVWIEEGFGKGGNFGIDLLPRHHVHVWPPVDDMNISSSKRPKILYYSWKELVSRGFGYLLGHVLRMDHIKPNSILLYVKDENNLGVCITTSKPPHLAKVRIGDLVSIKILEMRPLESISQVDQTICSLEKIALASQVNLKTWKVQEDDSPYKILNFPWELRGPQSSSLDSAALSFKDTFSRIRLKVLKISSILGKADHLLLHCKDCNNNGVLHCKDSNGGALATLNIPSEKVNTDLITIDSILILSNAAVVRSGEIFNVFIKPKTIIEIFPVDNQNVNTTKDAITVTDLESFGLTSSIKDSMARVVEGLPNNCEETIRITGHITSIGLGQSKIVALTCPECRKKFNSDNDWKKACTSCSKVVVSSFSNDDLSLWKPHFDCPISLTDSSGTWKNLNLHDPIASQLFEFSAERYLQFNPDEIGRARLKWLFKSVTLSIQVSSSSKDDRPMVRVTAATTKKASSITTTTTTTATATAVAVAVNVPKYRSNLERRLGWLSDKRHAIMKPMKSFGSRKIDEKILNQIKMDVARSFGQFEKSDTAKATFKRKRQFQLEDLLLKFFTSNANLYYYQGFHEVCSVIILTMRSNEEAYLVTDRLARTHLRDLMQSDFKVLHSLVEMMLSIVQVADSLVYSKLKLLSVPPYFCVSWILTWFAHDIPSLTKLQRLFDFFIANHPSSIVYASAAIPIIFGDELKGMDVESPEIHQWLKELPKRLEPSILITWTRKLMVEHPVDQLEFPTKTFIINQTVYGSKTRREGGAFLLVGLSLIVLIMAIVLMRMFT